MITYEFRIRPFKLAALSAWDKAPAAARSLELESVAKDGPVVEDVDLVDELLALVFVSLDEVELDCAARKSWTRAFYRASNSTHAVSLFVT